MIRIFKKGLVPFFVTLVMLAGLSGCESEGQSWVSCYMFLSHCEVTQSLQNQQTVFAEPTISYVSPAMGSREGGTTIDITGTGFRDGAIVTVGQYDCVEIQLLDETHIRCQTSPSFDVGLVEVKVLNHDDFKFAELENAFEYLEP